MSLTASGTAHAIGTNPLATDGPFSIWGWFNPTNVGQFKRAFSIDNSADNNQAYFIGTDVASTSGDAVAATYQSATIAGQVKGAALSIGTWYFLGASFASNGQPSIVVNQNAKNVGGTGFNPTVNQTLVNGRPTDFSNGMGAQFAHLSGTTRILADLEWNYLGGGGNPQWLDYKRYWKCAATETSTITDIAGQENLTCTSITAGSSDPPNGIATFWPGAGLTAQSATQGSAVTSIDWTTKFDKTAASVDYTVSLFTRSAPGTATTATAAAATNSNLVTVADATNFSAGGYASITSNSDPLLILAKSGNTLMLGGFRTWANSAAVYPFTVSAKTFTFYTSGNTFSGTPVAGDVGTYTLIPRAANNTTPTLIADGPAFQLTIASSGAAPSFSAGPTLTNPTTDGYAFAATSNQTATWWQGVYLRGSATPTATNLINGTGTGFVSHFSTALTATVAGTNTATGLTAPIYDVYHCLTNGNGNSAVVSFTSQLIAPAATKQFVPATVISISAITKANPVNITTSSPHGKTTGQQIQVYGVGGMTQLNTALANTTAACTVIDSTHLTLPIDSTGFTTYTSGGSLSWGQSIDAGSSVVVATGDIRVLDKVTTPDGMAITCQPDGSISIAGPITRRQNFAADIYDVSGAAFIGGVTEYFQDLAPQPSSVVSNFLPPIYLPANQTITPVNIAALATDPQSDTLTVSSSALPSGLSLGGTNNALLQGTTPASAITDVTFTWTNAAQESASADYNLVVGQVTPPNLTGMQQGDIVALLSGLYLSATFGVQDNAAPAGSAIAQNPPVGTPVTPPATINVTLSSGVAVLPPPVVTSNVALSPEIQLEMSLNRLNQFSPVNAYGNVVASATDPPGFIYRAFRIPSGARITELWITNAANPSNSAYKIGVLNSPNGSLVVPNSDSIFCTGLSCDNARDQWSNIYAPAIAGGAFSVGNLGLRVWELLGLPTDPSYSTLTDVLYDVVITAITPGQSGGSISLRAAYLPAPPRGLAFPIESPW